MKLTEPAIAHHYTRMQIETASRQKKLAMLHERCAVLIIQALSRTGSEKRRTLNRAQNILAQLEAALRMEDVVSQGLYYVYDYTYLLLERGEVEDCKKAIEVFSIIRDAFRELLLQIQ